MFKGLSLLDHRVRVATAREAESRLRVDHAVVGNTLPSALLPAFRGESAIVGEAALQHRRGVGLDWPPEARFDPEGGGPGRIPLATCWGRLFGKAWDDARLNQPFSWQPRRGETYQARPADLLAASALSFAEHGSDDELVVVVPDRLDDGGVETLRDAIAGEQTRRFRGRRERGRVRLLWRSAAIALAWCRRFADEFAGRGVAEEEGEPLGHIAVVSLGMDSFEVVVCEVVARKFGGRTWLLPVVDRRFPTDLIGPWGISLLACLTLGTESGRHASTVFADLLRIGGSALDSPAFAHRALQEVTALGLTAAGADLTEREVRLREFLPAGSGEESSLPLGRRLLQAIQRRVSALPPQSRPVLGAVIEGAAGRLQLRAGRPLRQVFRAFLEQRRVPSERILDSEGELASIGAARFGWCTATGRPTYRERLQPLEFFATGRDELGDAKAEWTSLLDVETVEGGRVHRRVQPIRGFQIDAGTDELKLLLRATRRGEKPVVRAVPARLDRVVRTEQPVELDVSVEPGQGYARVDVRSAEPGLFRCSLDWRRMVPSAVPTIRLSYVKEVFRVKADPLAWLGQGRRDADLIAAELQRPAPDRVLLHRLKQWREAQLNKPQRDETDRWVYWHPVSSDGTVPGNQAPALLARISQAMAERFRTTGNTDLKKEILRCGGWTFMALDPALMESLRADLRRVLAAFDKESRRVTDRWTGGTKRVLWKRAPAMESACGVLVDAHLTAIGHAFERESDLSLVFAAALARFIWTMDRTNNWLRALRNIVRYRQHALHPSVVPRKILDELTALVVQKLEEQINDGNFHKLFDNCHTILTFLLKRRRYEPDFPSRSGQIECLLDRVISSSGAMNRQREWAKLTLHFLKREGTGADLAKFLSLTEEL